MHSLTAHAPAETKLNKATTIALCLACLALTPGLAGAALSDEIQVYTDEINAPREWGLELHINTTPKGRQTPDYPGEAVPHHGLRFTPEISYGLTETWEAGLYLPTNRDASGNFSFAGSKLRLKWLPIRGDEKTGGWFLGANGELSHLQKKFSESRWSSELRIMMGYRDETWLFAANPIFGWNLSDGLRSKTADVSLALKASRKVSDNLALGAEYYSDLGTTARLLGVPDQGHTLYAVMDLEMKKWSLNFGVGHGLTDAADKWTVKTIVGFSF
jgi:hypothetical protein